MKLIIPGVCIPALLLTTACSNTEPKAPKEQPVSVDTTVTAVPEKEPEVIPTFTYTAWPIKTSDSLKKALKNFSEEELKIIETLNRADTRHLPRIDTIIIPNKFKNLLAYSPFPKQVDILNDVSKFVIFSYPIQAFGVYEKGQLVKWGPTNMGKKATPTPKGLFFSNWKGKEIISSVNKSWILKWNFNIHNTGGVGWHQYDLPGYPASHSCLRLLAEDAKWLYDWADQWILKKQQLVAQGTPTIVFGDYPWGERRPWKAILEQPDALQISVDSMHNVIQPHIEKIKQKQTERIDYLNSIAVDTLQ